MRQLVLALLLLAIPSASLAEAVAPNSDDTIEIFTPRPSDPDHSIDYSIWSYALSQFVVSMGPPLRKNPNLYGSLRARYGHNSLYRLDGSMVGFSFMTPEVIESFAEYRRDLEGVAEKIDIPSLSRNEQLAYWLNLHNVAMVEQIAKAWPTRIPSEITIDGAPLDTAKVLSVRGVALSLKDIRTRIVYPHWKDARVFYGFWRGEIGGPAMRREAFTAANVADLLERAATEFVNSRRGTEKRGKTLHASMFYDEAAPFYFQDFQADLRAHLIAFSNEEMTKRISKTETIKLTLRERDIADLAGGTAYNAFWPRERIGVGVAFLLSQRNRKFEYIERKGERTGTVTFTPIDLPGFETTVEEVK